MHLNKLFILALLSSTQLHAESSSYTSLEGMSSSAYNYTKEHFSASYHGEVYASRRDLDSEVKTDHQVKDFKIMHNPSVVYKPNSNWQVTASAEFKFSDQPSDVAGASFPNSFYRSLATIQRKNILEEKDHGIKLDAGISRRQFNTGKEQRSDGKYSLPSFGNNRAFVTLTKNIAKNNASLMLQYLHNDYKKSTATTWKQGLEVYPTINLQLTDKLSYLISDDILINSAKAVEASRKTSITHDMNIGYLNYQWNDNISTYNQLKYLHSEGFTNAFQSQSDSFENYIGVGYSFNPKSTITFEVGGEIARARDNSNFLSKKITSPEYAMYLDFAI